MLSVLFHLQEASLTPVKMSDEHGKLGETTGFQADGSLPEFGFIFPVTYFTCLLHKIHIMLHISSSSDCSDLLIMMFLFLTAGSVLDSS